MFIELKDAVRRYGSGESAVYALHHANLSLEQGKVCVILGPSGSGKSTLLNVLGGLDSLDAGTVTVGGKRISDYSGNELTDYRREDVGFVFQFYNLIPDLTAEENIAVVSETADAPLEIEKLLQELSGGQQQRVAIARAMVKNPKLLLCDELTGALDTKASANVLACIERMNQEFGTTVLIITHNEAIAGMADVVLRLRDGEVVSSRANDDKKAAKDLIL